MSHSQAAHARKITDRFVELLGEELSYQVGEKHILELALLIESAINASVLKAEETLLSKLQIIIDEIRMDAQKLSFN